MRRIRRLFLSVVVVGAVGAALLPAPAAADTQLRVGVFASATDVLKYRVTASGPGTLIVDTMDCCIPGDSWGARIFRTKPTTGTSKPACGNGSVTEFSGATHITSFVHGRVEIRYCHGVDIFPAGMTVRFRHPQALTITP
jgi:hypothetical protein